MFQYGKLNFDNSIDLDLSYKSYLVSVSFMMN